MSKSLTKALANKYIICSCEGAAERAVVNLLVDAGKVCFSRDALVNEEVTNIRSGYRIEEHFLNWEYDREIVLLRILDRTVEKIKFHKQYIGRVTVYDICTKPEIESLVILSEGKWENFKRSKYTQPSDYCKSVLKMKNVKQEQFIKEYFCDVEKLVKAVILYDRKVKDVVGKHKLSDLLK